VMAAATGNDRRPTVTGRVVGMMLMSEVGDSQEGRRHEPTSLGMLGQAHAALKMP